MKIVIDSLIPFIEGVFEPYAEVVYLKGEDMRHDDIADAALVKVLHECGVGVRHDD